MKGPQGSGHPAPRIPQRPYQAKGQSAHIWQDSRCFCSPRYNPRVKRTVGPTSHGRKDEDQVCTATLQEGAPVTQDTAGAQSRFPGGRRGTRPRGRSTAPWRVSCGNVVV